MTQIPEAAILINYNKFLEETKFPQSRVCSFLPKMAASLQIVEDFPEFDNPFSKHNPLSLKAPAILQKILVDHYSITKPSKSVI